MSFVGVIFAAAAENKMKSKLPTALHKVCGKETVKWAAEAVKKAGAEALAVAVCSNAEKIAAVLDGLADNVISAEQSDTAVCRITDMAEGGSTVLLNGAAPLITADTVKNALEYHEQSKNDVTAVSADGITVMYILNSAALRRLLAEAAEEGMCDILAEADRVFSSAGVKIGEYAPKNGAELTVISDRIQLAGAERLMRERINEYHMRNGVTLIMPETTIIEDGVEIGEDTVIYPNTHIASGTVIGCDCVVGSGSKIAGSKICDGVNIQASVILDSEVGEGTTVGPFAYIRPNTRVGKKARIGDFVELKNSVIDDGTKVSHLTYVGDSDVGKRVNFGCGTVTVNYDGKAKHRTKIGNDCFIGCNTNLVAPVELRDGAYTAAGSTITDTVPENNLAIARARQINKDKWRDKRK